MREFVCIVCPNGCRLTVTEQEDGIKVDGARCKRGNAYAENEIKNPTRSVTSTVKTIFDEVPVLPVRTSREIPKDKIFELMRIINAFTLTKRVKRGEIVIPDVFGADIIATSDLLSKEEL